MFMMRKLSRDEQMLTDLYFLKLIISTFELGRRSGSKNYLLT